MFRLRSVTFAAPVLLVAAVSSVEAPGARPDSAPDRTAAQQTGQQIFEAVCSACHSVQPPAKLAPPMSHIARHYLAELPDTGQTVERIAAWVRQPAADRSLLDAHAIEMWGVMPPLELPEDQARAVARYVVSLADSAVGEMMGGMGMGRGMMRRDTTGAMGMGMGRGMMRRDTTGAMGMGMGRGMMRRDTTGAMGMGMGRGMMRRDTTAMMGRRRGVGADTLARPLRFRGG